MKTAIALFLGLGLCVAACDKKEQPATTSASTAAAKTTTSATPAPTPSAAAAPAPSASAAEKADEKKGDDDEQEGLEKGEVIVGYLQDLKDEGQCAALAAKEAEKAQYDAKKLEEVAKMMKAKVVTKCPTENVQGTCRIMKDMLVNYTGPKYTPESAKKHCTQNRGKWYD